MNLFLSILWDKRGGTLAITRVTANTLITAVATNNRATEIEAVVNGDIDATNIEDAAITVAKLGTAAVETAKIKDANVTTDKIADANVTTAKIADANVTAAKLANDAVETAKIKDAAVTNAKLAGSIDLTAKVTGTLPVGNGGTGTTGAANAASGVVVLDANGKLPQGNGQTQITAVVSTINTSYEDISGLTVTITTIGGNVLVAMSSNAVYSLTGGTTYFKAVLDGATSSGESFVQDITNAFSHFAHFSWLFTSVAAGSHTFKIQWKTSGATPKLNTKDGTNALGSTRIIAIEL